MVYKYNSDEESYDGTCEITSDSDEQNNIDLNLERDKIRDKIEDYIYLMWKQVMKDECDFHKFRYFIIKNNPDLYKIIN